MSREALKMTLATAFLVGAVALLAFQIVGRAQRNRAAGGDVAAPAEMTEPADRAREPLAVAWEVPEAVLAASLAENPFLRPAGAGATRISGRRAPTVTGIRTGKPASVVINDRILIEGETVAGWRVLSVERDRVTLRSSDGKTIRLTP